MKKKFDRKTWMKIYNKELVKRQRRIFFDHYGRKCSCCGETIPQFLTIDHINGGGNKDRTSTGRKRGGHELMAKIIKEGLPDTYRVLCWNCNSGRHINGGVCPHEEL